MPYYFRCDVCGTEEQVSEGEDFGHQRNCEDCGQDGCQACQEGGVCDSCSMNREAENEEDGYGL